MSKIDNLLACIVTSLVELFSKTSEFNLFFYPAHYFFHLPIASPTFRIPPVLFPFTFPPMILRCRQTLRSIHLNQDALLFPIIPISFLSFPILVSPSSFLILAVYFTLIISLCNYISKLFICRSHLFLIVHVSKQYTPHSECNIKHILFPNLMGMPLAISNPIARIRFPIPGIIASV